MEKKEPTRRYLLSQLQNSSKSPILDKQLSEGFKNPVVKGVTEHIDTKTVQPILSGAGHMEKIAALRAAKAAGKKLLGALPFAGAGFAALSGDPAMAAEELAQDAAGPVGLAYEAIKPTPTGPAAGSLDDRIEKGTLTDEDKQLLRRQSLQQLK